MRLRQRGMTALNVGDDSPKTNAVTRISAAVLAVTAFLAASAGQAIEIVAVDKEIDDDRIIISRSNGERLLLEKWSLRFSPLNFEGESFPADVSPMWVTIYFEDRDPIKWSVEESLGESTPSTSHPRPYSSSPLSDSLRSTPANLVWGGWRVYETTTIDGAISGVIENGSIMKTVTGHIYEVVDYIYLYEYEYNPEVLILQDGDRFRLLIKGIDDVLLCRKLNGSAENGGSHSSSLMASDVIESHIVSEFEGFEYGNVYKLENGQIWEQTEAWIWLWIWIRPKVLIYRTGSSYKMSVEQIDHPVTVKRLK